MSLDLGNGASLKLVRIPAGKFLMGSPEAEQDRGNDELQHEVTISRAFFMGTTEVTQKQYLAVMGTKPSQFTGDNLPVEKVSWSDAADFCQKLSVKDGRKYRLPTEAEWEYACRAGTTARFGFGDKAEELYKYGNYCDKSNTNGYVWQDLEYSDGFDKTAPVGSFRPNPWGLYDMHGNVQEWCSDWYGPYPQGKATDPTGPREGTRRVLRGGPWRSAPRICRTALRGQSGPGYRYDDAGFRVVLESP